MSSSRTRWLCITGNPDNHTQFAVLSEHQTLQQARGTKPLHQMRGIPNLHIIQATTTYAPV